MTYEQKRQFGENVEMVAKALATAGSTGPNGDKTITFHVRVLRYGTMLSFMYICFGVVLVNGLPVRSC